jgi:hypothetical protein
MTMRGAEVGGGSAVSGDESLPQATEAIKTIAEAICKWACLDIPTIA